MAHKIYGLVGHPLGHSFSAPFFNARFEREGMDAEYRNYDLDCVDGLRRLIETTPELCGLNVTIPYKEAVIPMLDALSETAAAIGAVNVIHISRRADGGVFLTGHNTDVVGFDESFCALLRDAKAPRHALVLGTGGASKAACYALRQAGLTVKRVSRSPKDDYTISYASLREPGVMERYKVIVNATPLGTYPNTDACPDIPYELLTPAHFCFDLVYNPPLTRFLHEASTHGCVLRNGLAMLHTQALAAWAIWNALSV